MRQTTLDTHFNVVCKSSSIRSQNAKAKKDVPSKNKRNSYAKHSHVRPAQFIETENDTDCTITYASVTENAYLTPKKTPNARMSEKNSVKSSHSSPLKRNSSYVETHSLNDTTVVKNEVIKIEGGVSSSKRIKEEEKVYLKTEDEVDKSSVLSTPRKGLKYSPKVSTPRARSHFASRSCSDADLSLAKCALEQMNYAKQGAIPPNNFDLEIVYSKATFKYRYNVVNTKTAREYEFESVVLPPDEMYAKILFNAIVTVFANPVNCGYFDESELDFVYSILTLSPNAQILLGRMLKRVRTWHRGTVIKYPDIPNIQQVFQELESKSMCTFNTMGENVSTILKILQADEISDICKTLKLRNKGKKKTNIDALLTYLNLKPFPGAKTPRTILQSLIIKKIDYCVRLTERMWNLFDKVLTLLIPNRDAQETTADTIFLLFQVFAKQIRYPRMPTPEFPIFSCEEHLQSYIRAKATLTNMLNSIVNKKWEEVRDFGDLAEKEWQAISETESERLKNSTLPMHVRYFMPGYVWLKVLSGAVDAYKKILKERAVNILSLLLEQDCHMKYRRGQWYAELALIEMHHKKDFEGAARIIIEGLTDENTTRVAKVDLIDKAERIAKKKTGVSKDTRQVIKSALETIVDRVVPKYIITTNEIEGRVGSRSVAGFKSKWLVESDAEGQSYGSVESLALSHYLNEGFSNGVHCEGALPVILFSLLFWEELYDANVPGAFVTRFQDAPQDLYFDKFYENRRETIDARLSIFRSLDGETFSSIMEDKFNVCCGFQSIMPSTLFRSTARDTETAKSSQFREVVYCLGVEAVVGICERLLDNYKLWRAGFPDLFLWNFSTKEYKIVEVKGPGDTLSTKQKLWFEYLSNLGLSVELCRVKDTSNSR